MLKLLVISLILILGAVTIFGFLGLGFIDHNGQHLCLFSVVSGGDCPNNVFSLAIHHIAGLQSFSQAIFLFLIFALILVSLFRKSLVLETSHLYTRSFYSLRERVFTPTKDILFWLSLHNKRDPTCQRGCVMLFD